MENDGGNKTPGGVRKVRKTKKGEKSIQSRPKSDYLPRIKSSSSSKGTGAGRFARVKERGTGNKNLAVRK